MASSIYRLHSEDEYAKALAEYESYFDSGPEPGSEAARRFETLGLVLADYESRTCAVPAAEPADVLRFVLESNGRSQSDLAHLLGSRSRASEYLNGRRDLSLEHIRLISREWHVPADALIGTLAHA